MNKQQQPDSSIHDTTAHCPCEYQVSIFLASQFLKKEWWKISTFFFLSNFQRWKLERKKNEEIKWWISSSSLIPVYMIHLPTVHVWTKFQSSRPYSSWETCDEKFQCWKLERENNNEIKGWIRNSSLIPVYMIHLAHCPLVYQVSIF